MAENFDVNLNDEVENFVVEFGEIQRITVDDFDKLRNRPSYDSQLMTHETNIPKVPANVSELNNDSDYQTGEEVAQALEAKQDKLTTGNNIQISEKNVISATDTVYSAGNGINISPQNVLSVDTTVVATQQELSNEVHNRENADNYLQGQIDAISASSDVVDIVGTYADLQNYDTQHLKDNDIIKVLQDETQGNATTYYRWSTSTQTFTLIGQEGPYYTKAGADAQFVPQTRTVNGKALDSNIALNASDVSALGPDSVAQITGSSTSQIMSQKATTDALDTKLNASDYVVDTQLADSDNPVQNRVLNGLLGNMPSDFFSGEATITPTASTEVQFGNILSLDDVKLLGDTFQQTYSGKNIINFATISYSGANNGSGTRDGATFTVTGAPNGNYGGVQFNQSNLQLKTDTTYTFSATVVSTTNTDGSMVYVNSAMSNTGSQIYGKHAKAGERTVITFTTPSSITNSASIRLYPATVDGVAVFTDIMVEESATATSYEPYTGGVPAPNPDYPQPVNVVTGTQTVKVTGKNLWGGFSNSYSRTNAGVYFTTDKDGSITASGKSNQALALSISNTLAQSNNMYITLSQGTYVISADYTDGVDVDVMTISNTTRLARAGSGDASFTLAASTDVFVRLGVPNGTSIDRTIKVQIEAGTTPTAYEPYQSQSYTVDLGSIELCKIGDYQDYIYKSGDDWYVHKEIGKSALGGLNWYDEQTSPSTGGAYRLASNDITSTVLAPANNADLFNGLCSHYTPVSADSAGTYGGIIGIAIKRTGIISVYDPNYNASTSADDFKTWLANNNVTLYYTLATPTDTKITDATLISELEALLSASTYDGETDFVITATGTNLPAPLQLTAINANAKGLIERMRA